MKLLLTSAGISNKSIHNALVELLGKPIAEANALFVPTGVYPFRYGQRYAWNPISGEAASRMCQLGWKSMGILELSVLPSIDKNNWLPSLEEADALLVWGGDPLFISYWMQQSGLSKLLPSLIDNLVYVGVSAGSMTVASIFAETYSAERSCAGNPLTIEEIVFSSSEGETRRLFDPDFFPIYGQLYYCEEKRVQQHLSLRCNDSKVDYFHQYSNYDRRSPFVKTYTRAGVNSRLYLSIPFLH